MEKQSQGTGTPSSSGSHGRTTVADCPEYSQAPVSSELTKDIKTRSTLEDIQQSAQEGRFKRHLEHQKKRLQAWAQGIQRDYRRSNHKVGFVFCLTFRILWKLLLFVLLGLALISLLTELTRQTSLTQYLQDEHVWTLSWTDQWMHIINTDAIFEMVKTVGVCSVLISWIYTERNSKETGISYFKILQQTQPHFHIHVVLHYILVIVCMWAASMEFLELSIILLLLIFWEILFQFRLSSLVVFRSETRRKKAIDLWEKSVEQDRQQGAQKMLLDVLQIARLLAAEQDALQDDIVDLTRNTWIQTLEQAEAESHTEKQSLLDAEKVWSAMLQGKSIEERSVVARNILCSLICEKANYAEGIICTSFVLYLWRNAAPNSPEDTNARMTSEIHDIVQCIPSNYATAGLLQSCVSAVLWADFICNKRNMDYTFFDLTSSESTVQYQKYIETLVTCCVPTFDSSEKFWQAFWGSSYVAFNSDLETVEGFDVVSKREE